MFLCNDRRLYFLFAELSCFAMSLQASTANYLQLYFRFACVFSILAVVCTLSCRCNPSCPDAGPCAHGTVRDPCSCCDVCAKGLGERCGGPYNIYGRCGVELVCNINMTIHIALRAVGECIREGGTMNTTSHNVTNHNVTNNNKTNHNTSLNATNPDSSDCATNDTTTINVTTSTRGCREKCSIQFCSQRARICSARGMEYSKVQTRNDCQHTSCRACFMFIKPNCTRCPEPPNKKCLRRYYECVELHYTLGDALLRLGDPTIHTVEGEVFCHVPDVGTFLEDSMSDSH